VPWVNQPAVKLPPIHHTVHGEFGSVVRYAHGDVTSVPSEIINPKRDRDTLGVTREVCVNRYWLPTPSLARTSVIPDELLLFCIDAHDRHTLREMLHLL
jgi:hypothetical protein